MRQGRTDSVPLSLSTLLSPSGTESIQREGGREEASSGAVSRAPYEANGRDPSESEGSSPSGLNGISPSGAPSEAEVID